MTTLRNTIDRELCFEFNGRQVKVPPMGEGGKMEVEHKQVRFLLMCKLPLEVVEGTETGDTDEEEPKDPELALWMKRAKDAERDLGECERELDAAHDRASDAEAALTASTVEVEKLKADLETANASLHSAASQSDLETAKAEIEHLKSELAAAHELLNAPAEKPSDAAVDAAVEAQP